MITRPSAVIVAGAFCLLPWALVLAVQNPPPPQFRAGVDVFRLEVSVFDRTHEPVRGLKSANFSVFENGKLQPIVSFDEVEFPEYDGPLLESIEDNAPDVTTTRYENRRLITIVLDDYGWPMTPACSPEHPELLYVAKEAR